MKITRIAPIALIFAMITGCAESVGEGQKRPIQISEIPAEIVKVAQETHPDITFDSAFTEIEDGQPVYEMRGKSKTGKVIEVEVTKEGKLLK